MSDVILSIEQMEAQVKKKYMEWLPKRLVRITDSSVTKALMATTEAMMEKSWSAEQKTAFKNFLFLSGFKPRSEGKKCEELHYVWYFPVAPKSLVLQEIRDEYEKALRNALDKYAKRAEDEIKNFCEEARRVTVIKTENSLYRKIFLEQLKDSEIPIPLYHRLTEHNNWLVLSKTEDFFGVPEELENVFRKFTTNRLEKFVSDLNFVIECRKKFKNIRAEDRVGASNKFVLYLTDSVCKEFVRIFEPLGFKFAYSPCTYEADYTRLDVSPFASLTTYESDYAFFEVMSSYVEVFVTLDVPEMANDLGYGWLLNQEYNNFCRNYC